MVFTQYTDTMDFLRDELAAKTHSASCVFSGRGGEVRDKDDLWRAISRVKIEAFAFSLFGLLL
jgi:hypothetical protein